MFAPKSPAVIVLNGTVNFLFVHILDVWMFIHLGFCTCTHMLSSLHYCCDCLCELPGDRPL